MTPIEAAFVALLMWLGRIWAVLCVGLVVWQVTNAEYLWAAFTGFTAFACGYTALEMARILRRREPAP